MRRLTRRAARSPTRCARRALGEADGEADDRHDEDDEPDRGHELERPVPPALRGQRGHGDDREAEDHELVPDALHDDGKPDRATTETPRPQHRKRRRHPDRRATGGDRRECARRECGARGAQVREPWERGDERRSVRDEVEERREHQYDKPLPRQRLHHVPDVAVIGDPGQREREHAADDEDGDDDPNDPRASVAPLPVPLVKLHLDEFVLPDVLSGQRRRAERVIDGGEGRLIDSLDVESGGCGSSGAPRRTCRRRRGASGQAGERARVRGGRRRLRSERGRQPFAADRPARPGLRRRCRAVAGRPPAGGDRSQPAGRAARAAGTAERGGGVAGSPARNWGSTIRPGRRTAAGLRSTLDESRLEVASVASVASRRVRLVATGVNSFAWSPSGKVIAFSAGGRCGCAVQRRLALYNLRSGRTTWLPQTDGGYTRLGRRMGERSSSPSTAD